MTELCQSCTEENKSTKSDGFCRDCEEHMCQVCFQHHLKAKYCRSHVLLQLEGNERPERNLKNVEKCEKHDNQPVRYYCRKHNQVGCGDCMLFEGHTSCHPELIHNIASNIQEQKEFKGMTAKLKAFSNENKANVKNLQANGRINNEMNSKLLESASGFRSRLDSVLDKAEADMLAQIKRVRQENELFLKKLESDCKSIDSDIEDCQEKLSSTHFPEHVLFINSVSVKPKLRLIEETIQKTKGLSKIAQYEFKPDKKLDELAAALKSLGTLEKVIEKVSRDTTSQNNKDADRGSDTPIIQVFVNFLAGKTIICSVSPSETIATLKQRITDKEGIPTGKIMLQMAFTGKQLRDELQVSDYDIHNESTVNCRMSLAQPKE